MEEIKYVKDTMINLSVLKRFINTFKGTGIHLINSIEERKDCFNTMISNINIALISLGGYINILENITNPKSNNEVIIEYKDNTIPFIIEIQKILLIKIFSRIEYSIHKIIKDENVEGLINLENKKEMIIIDFESLFKSLPLTEQDKYKLLRKRIINIPNIDSLYNILERAKSKGRIINDDLNKWSFIIDYRNDLIHNNGISRKNKKLIHNDEKYEMIIGQPMITNNLHYSLRFIEFLTYSYYIFLEFIDTNIEEFAKRNAQNNQIQSTPSL